MALEDGTPLGDVFGYQVRFDKRASARTRVLVVTPGDEPNQRLCDGIYDVLNDACLDLVTAGRVERARYERLTMPVYFRTLAELRAPLEDASSSVRGLFTVDRAEILAVPTPFNVAFQQTGDATAFADEYTQNGVSVLTGIF